jgi:CheY-like chemotaxis protein
LSSVLQRFGYRVQESVSGAAAWEFFQAHSSSIDLMITDIVMPGGLSGRELAERARTLNPALKVIYCSGYTDDMLGQDSPLRNNVNFFEKPIDPRKFLLRVRDYLDER